MWMMGCSDGGGFNVGDSFSGRRLRPLIPRPSSSSSSSSSSTTTVTSSTTATNNSSSTNHIGATAAHPCFGRIHGSTDHFVLNHHLATVMPHEQISKRSDFGAPATVMSSRWNPTPEQLRILEELYRRGTRTPTAEQIQQITAQLRRFGKIEGKNVFYWFQNHKARERQKRRRRAEEQQQQQRDSTNSTGGGGTNLLHNNKESGSSRTDFEVEDEAKNWALPTNCSTLPETASMRRAERTVAAGAVVSETKTHVWMQFEEEELKQRRKLIEKHQTWKMMQQLHFSPNTHFMNASITTSSASTATSTTTTRTPSAAKMRIMNSSKFIINTQNLSDQCIYPLTHFPGLDDLSNINGEDQSDHTLQLFPLSSSAHEDHDHQNEINCADDDIDHAKENDQEEVHPISVVGVDSSSSTNYQFIEFL